LIHLKLPKPETIFSSIAFHELHGIGSAGTIRKAVVFLLVRDRKKLGTQLGTMVAGIGTIGKKLR